MNDLAAQSRDAVQAFLERTGTPLREALGEVRRRSKVIDIECLRRK